MKGEEPLLEAALAAAKGRLDRMREQERAELRSEAAAGGSPERVALLPRIRALVSEILMPLVRRRRRLLDEVGMVWLGEEIWRRGHLPRIFIEYHARLIAPEAPAAALILGFHEEGTVILTWNFKAPLRHTATRLRRLDDLSPELVTAEVDAFLAAAMLGRISE